MVNGGEVDDLEDFQEEKARQSSEVRAKIMMATDGIHILYLAQASHANYVCS